MAVYSARVEPGGREFSIKPGESILDAALRSGVSLKYGCRHGNCSSCKYLVTDGEVDYGNASPYSLSNAERDDGWVLLCCATALDDVQIQDDRVFDQRQRPLITPGEFDGQVTGIDRLTPSLRRLHIRTEQPVVFYAGQFVEIAVPGAADQWRSYSLASAPSSAQELEFVIKVIDGGAFSEQLDLLGVGVRMRVRGPFGDGYLREGNRPVLLVATGSGISPILSILEYAAHCGDERKFTFFYGARTAAELPCESRMEELRGVLDLTYCPVLSKPTPECGWLGEPSRVTAHVQRRIGDGAPYDAYVCGKPEMCDAVIALLEAKGTPEETIFSDKFFPAVEDHV
ncbi:2Fe-2S iron-sulfur cluster-binding protein [Mycobacterium sp. 050272]|uniref:2Fe-2S iron-sulfur cluster-binding protein n=1 Tax=Mycobacterium sp. 050272 TaxID=3142488 RepID=UPI0031988F24